MGSFMWIVKPILWIYCVSVLNGSFVDFKVGFYEFCHLAEPEDNHLLVGHGDKIILSIDGSVILPPKSCYMLLRAKDEYSDLFVKFVDFALTDDSTTLTLTSSFFSISYSTDAAYDSNNYPNTFSSMKTNTYLNISYTNPGPMNGTLSASLEIYIEEDTDTDHTFYVPPQRGLRTTTIIRIVCSCVGVIVAIVLVVVFCVIRKRSRRQQQQQTVMMVPVQNGSTTNAPYAYAVPPEQPGYAGPAPPYQTVYPNAPYPPAYPQQAAVPPTEEKVDLSKDTKPS